MHVRPWLTTAVLAPSATLHVNKPLHSSRHRATHPNRVKNGKKYPRPARAHQSRARKFHDQMYQAASLQIYDIQCAIVHHTRGKKVLYRIFQKIPFGKSSGTHTIVWACPPYLPAQPVTRRIISTAKPQHQPKIALIPTTERRRQGHHRRQQQQRQRNQHQQHPRHMQRHRRTIDERRRQRRRRRRWKQNQQQKGPQLRRQRPWLRREQTQQTHQHRKSSRYNNATGGEQEEVPHLPGPRSASHNATPDINPLAPTSPNLPWPDVTHKAAMGVTGNNPLPGVAAMYNTLGNASASATAPALAPVPTGASPLTNGQNVSKDFAAGRCALRGGKTQQNPMTNASTPGATCVEQKTGRCAPRRPSPSANAEQAARSAEEGR